MSEDRVPCPDCRELIVRGAKVCRFCGRGRAHASAASRPEDSPPLEDSQRRALEQQQKWLESGRRQEERIKEEMRQQGR